MINKLSIIYRTFGSAKLAIFLFFTLAVTSILGTVVPQGLSPEQYRSLYNPGLYALFDFFDVFDLFHSWWFTALLGLLAVNLIVCTVIQGRRIYRVYLSPKEGFEDDSVFRSTQFTASFRSDRGVTEMAEETTAILKSSVGKVSAATRDGKTYLFAEKGKYSRLGMVFVHVSVIFILAGSLIAAIWGFDGTMKIIEGERSNRVLLSGGRHVLALGFDIRCDDFTVEFYDTGMPKEYRSDISILEGGSEVLAASIRVNHPVRHRGIKFYQSTYGVAPKSRLVVGVTNRKTGEEHVLGMRMMEKTPLPGISAEMAVGEFKSDYQGHGPAVLGVLFEKGKAHEMFWIFPEGSHDATVKGDLAFVLKDVKQVYYTGLRVTKNPGMPLIWDGFLLVVIGFILNLFFVHQRVWVRIREDGTGTEISLAASSSRRGDVLEKRLQSISRALGVE